MAIKHSFAVDRIEPLLQHCLDKIAHGHSLWLRVDSPINPSALLVGAGVAANLLSNGVKSAFVSEDQQLLEDIYQHLDGLGLGKVVYFSKKSNNPNHSQQVQKQAFKPPMPTVLMRYLQHSAQQVQKWRERQQQFADFRPQGLSYPQQAADFLQQKPQNSNPNHQINLPKNLSGQELASLASRLQEAEGLYQPLGSFQHPFNLLNERFFKQNNLREASETLSETLDKVAFVVNAANRDAFSYLFKYEKWIDEHYTEVFVSQNGLIERISELCKEGQKYSKLLIDPHQGIGDKIGGFFKQLSGSGQRLGKIRTQTEALYDDLQSQQQQFNYVPHKFLDLRKETSFAELLDNVRFYSQNLLDWHKQKELIIRGHLQNWGKHQVHPHSNFLPVVLELVENLDNFETKLNQARLFKPQFQFNSDNIKQRVQALETLSANLEELKEKWADFEDYFNLKYFWLTINQPEQQLIQQLAEAKIQDWAGFFLSEYNRQILQQAEQQFVPLSADYEQFMQNLSADLQQVRKGLQQYIRSYWQANFNPSGDWADICEQFPFLLLSATEAQELWEANLTDFELVMATQSGYLPPNCPCKRLIINQELPNSTQVADFLIWERSDWKFTQQADYQALFEQIKAYIEAQLASARVDYWVELAEAPYFVPLLVENGQKTLAIYPDMYSFSEGKNGYIWELYSQQVCAEKGWAYTKIYSSDFVHQPQKALQKLLQALQKSA